MSEATRLGVFFGMARFDEILDDKPGPAQSADHFLPAVQEFHCPCFA
jgi:hypothetical protein